MEGIVGGEAGRTQCADGAARHPGSVVGRYPHRARLQRTRSRSPGVPGQDLPDEPGQDPGDVRGGPSAYHPPGGEAGRTDMCLPSIAKAMVDSRGQYVLAINATDIGTGARTALGVITAEELGVPADLVIVMVGDTTLPVATIADGSMRTASWVGRSPRRAGPPSQDRQTRHPGEWVVGQGQHRPGRDPADHPVAALVRCAARRGTGQHRHRRGARTEDGQGVRRGRIINPVTARSTRRSTASASRGSATRGSARSEWSVRRRRSRTGSSTRPASVFAICRSRWTACCSDGFGDRTGRVLGPCGSGH